MSALSDAQLADFSDLSNAYPESRGLQANRVGIVLTNGVSLDGTDVTEVGLGIAKNRVRFHYSRAETAKQYIEVFLFIYTGTYEDMNSCHLCLHNI